MISERIGMSLQAFMEAYDEQPFELVDGEKIDVAPQVTRSGRVAGRIFRILADCADAAQAGECFIEMPFVMMPDKPDWVEGSRVPDVMFVRAQRLAALAEQDPAWDVKPLALVPEVVEVVSPTDRHAAVARKVKRYLADGVTAVWVVDPENRVLTIYALSHQAAFGDGDLVTVGELISDCQIEVAKIFGSKVEQQ